MNLFACVRGVNLWGCQEHYKSREQLLIRVASSDICPCVCDRDRVSRNIKILLNRQLKHCWKGTKKKRRGRDRDREGQRDREKTESKNIKTERQLKQRERESKCIETELRQSSVHCSTVVWDSGIQHMCVHARCASFWAIPAVCFWGAVSVGHWPHVSLARPGSFEQYVYKHGQGRGNGGGLSRSGGGGGKGNRDWNIWRDTARTRERETPRVWHTWRRWGNESSCEIDFKFTKLIFLTFEFIKTTTRFLQWAVVISWFISWFIAWFVAWMSTLIPSLGHASRNARQTCRYTTRERV